MKKKYLLIIKKIKNQKFKIKKNLKKKIKNYFLLPS